MTQAISIDLEELRQRAFLKGDSNDLASMLDDDLEYIHSSGVVDGKTQFLEAIGSGELKYDALQFTGVRTLTSSSDTIVLNGNMAGVVLRRGEKIKIGAIYVAVWRKTSSKWTLRYFQSTKKPPQ